MRAMSRRRSLVALTAFVTTVLVAADAWASGRALLAQPEPPPPVAELGAPKPWTYWMARALVLAAAAALVGTVVLYVVKSRSFRPNQRRGGAK